MNNGMVFELAENFAARVEREAGADTLQQIDMAYQIALSRPPNDKEKQIGLQTLNQLHADWTSQLSVSGHSDPATVKSKSLTAYCHAIINSASFLFVD